MNVRVVRLGEYKRFVAVTRDSTEPGCDSVTGGVYCHLLFSSKARTNELVRQSGSQLCLAMDLFHISFPLFKLLAQELTWP